ncbi:MAG: glycosyltransferase family 4 protein [Anaerolineae bacterium]|nr:glycosyltransferase family 4 protein [Anaerolineae bacterium]
MPQPKVAILHYTAPPVVGGVEIVIQAHSQLFLQNRYPLTVIAGRGEPDALPEGTDFVRLPEVDSQHPSLLDMNEKLEKGEVPPEFDGFVTQTIKLLTPILNQFDHLIVHNIFTKHFNLPLTAALHTLLNEGKLPLCLAWCHDFTWTSPNSRSQVHPGYPWDLLRTSHPALTYVVVSQQRQQALAALFNCPPEQIHVVYNGVDPQSLLGLSAEGNDLIKRLDLLASDLMLLMPVRVTQAKNIEFALHVVAALKERGSRPKLILTGPPDPHDAQSMAYFRSLQDLRKNLDVEQEMRFVFESGPDPGEAFYIDPPVVADLFRLSDIMFMPSHREGFGMPILEAGQVGLPVFCSATIPAAREIGAPDIITFEPTANPADVAAEILAWANHNPVHQLRRRVRQNYTWPAIFKRHIEPLLAQPGDAPDAG